MKGDFSRLRFSPAEHFTAVLEQQGRVSLDSDSNEQRIIDEYLRGLQIIDTIGAVGGPIGAAGFKISVQDSTIQISGGRYYVSGLLCQGSTVDYMDQPFLIDPSVTDAEYLEELAAGSIDAICVKLQVWQRLVTALDDPCLLEPALGQADTTARLQTVWRVVASPLSSNTITGVTKAERPGRLCVQLSNTGNDCSCQPIPPAGYQGLENQLYRIEIHQPGDETTATFKWSRENASIVSAVTSYSGSNPQTIFVDSLGRDANLGFAANQWVEISDDTTEFGDAPNQAGQLCQISSVSPAGQPPSITFTTTVPAVDPTKNARVRRWDQPGTGTAGDMPLSVTTPIDIENGIQVTFTAGFYNSGDYWLIPARTASGTIDWPPCGSNGATCQPADTIPIYTVPLALITPRYTVGIAKPSDETELNPIDEASFNAGDPGDVLRGETGVSIQGEGDFLVQDLRSFFRPLSSNALHVTRISWTNDDVITLDELAASGLKLLLDGVPTSLVDASVFRVTIEIPEYDEAQRTLGATTFVNPVAASVGNAKAALKVTPVPRLRAEFVIDGVVSIVNDVLYWQLLPKGAKGNLGTDFGALLFFQLNLLLQAILYAPDPTWFARVRVRLLGHMIYSKTSSSNSTCGGTQTLYLDGQCFAEAGTRRDKTPRIALQYPSGNGAMASDFESWFYLAPVTTISSLTFNPASVTQPAGSATGSSVGTVQLATPASADTTVTLMLTPANGLTVTIPATITVPAGQSSQTFTADFTVTTQTPAAGVVCSVTAAVTWKISGGSSVVGSFTVIATNP
jgi:hypothetical protein